MVKASGTSSTTSQLSLICLPVPNPPWRNSPFRKRASKLMSNPFQWPYWLPKFDAALMTCRFTTEAFWS
jgi:hypothetical protein